MRRLSLLFCSLLAPTSALSAQSRPQAKPAAPPPARIPAATGMTNADVIKMVKAGLAESVIIAGIRQAEKRRFTLTADGLIDLKTSGVSDAIIHVMLDPSAAAAAAAAPAPAPLPPAPAAAPPAAATSPDAPMVPEIGVYYRKDKAWADILPEVVNWKTGGVLKNIATVGLVKGDVNGLINGARSRVTLKQPAEILVYTAEGVAITEYQLLRLRTNKDTREFRTVTGGVLHVSGGAARDLVPFESKKAGVRTHTLVLPNLGSGEYGVLSPGAGSASSAAAQLGKIYTFTIE